MGNTSLKPLEKFYSHEEKVADIACSPDHSFFASVGEDKCLCIYDAKYFMQTHKLLFHKNPIQKLCISDSKQICTVSMGQCILWSPKDFTPIQ